MEGFRSDFTIGIKKMFHYCMYWDGNGVADAISHGIKIFGFNSLHNLLFQRFINIFYFVINTQFFIKLKSKSLCSSVGGTRRNDDLSAREDRTSKWSGAQVSVTGWTDD